MARTRARSAALFGLRHEASRRSVSCPHARRPVRGNPAEAEAARRHGRPPRREDPLELQRLRAPCKRWAADTGAKLRGDPFLPGKLDDRPQNNWRPEGNRGRAQRGMSDVLLGLRLQVLHAPVAQ